VLIPKCDDVVSGFTSLADAYPASKPIAKATFFIPGPGFEAVDARMQNGTIF
jgi:hypothetical protein